MSTLVHAMDPKVLVAHSSLPTRAKQHFVIGLGKKRFWSEKLIWKLRFISQCNVSVHFLFPYLGDHHK